MEIGRYPEQVADHPLTVGALPVGSQYPCSGHQSRSFKANRSGWWSGGKSVQLVGFTLRRYRIPVFYPGDGRLSIHYRSDYPSAAGSDYPSPRTADERESARDPNLDGKVDHYFNGSHGYAFCNWAPAVRRSLRTSVLPGQTWCLPWRSCYP
jgi:hypothetical protein